jgi:MFS family permease
LLDGVFGIFNMITTIPGGLLADKRGERVGIVLGFLLESAAMVVILQVDSGLGFGLAWALFGIGEGLLWPAYQSLTSKAVPEKLRGTAFGFLHSSLGLFSLPAPAIGGQLWERFSPRVPFALTAVAAFVATIPAWFKFKLTKADKVLEVQGEPSQG